ncbi:MAG: ABC transporter substrate-binding protein, partial [Nitrososphaeraceae archaeon]
YAPWYANMPGYQNPGFWQYQNATLDDITQKLVFSNFTSELERNKLLKYATQMGIEESVRIFLVNNIDPFAASSSISGLVNDFGGGITNKYSLLNAESNKTDSLNIGVKQIYQGAWNSVGGFSDTYSTNIYSNIADSSTLRHPFTGEVISMRNEILNVTTLGPHDKLEVDPEAIVWNSKNGWITAEENSKSLSKVTYKILYSNWHNGIPIDKSDLLYSLYFLFEWGSDDGVNDLTKDPEYTSRVKVALPLYKGFKFSSNDTLESFIDIWHFDKKEIAGNTGLWPQEPWEITAATERLVLSNILSFSKSQAITKNADWLSLVVPEHANLIKKELIKMKNEKFVPLPLKKIVTVDEAIKRYDASIKWIEDRQHAVISNGPFFLDSYNPSGRTMEIKAFRDNTYPFEQGYWSHLEKPKTIQIKNFTHSKYIKIGQEKLINFQSFADDIPESNISIYYFLLDYSGKIVKSGEATSIKDQNGFFQILLDEHLTKNLTLGPVTLKIFANSKEALRPFVSDNIFLVTH